VRSSDNRAVCNARVHICEVDRLPLWILQLPVGDIFRLRDDLLAALRNVPIPHPGPGPDPGPLAQRVRSTLRFAENASPVVSLNPQPLPPRETIRLAPKLHARLHSTSELIVREALIENWKLIVPWFCLWPHW
jgi:hypothetical protein